MSSTGDWSEVKDAASGKNYYVNKRTNVTQWEVPAGFGSGADRPSGSPSCDGSSGPGTVHELRCPTDWRFWTATPFPAVPPRPADEGNPLG